MTFEKYDIVILGSGLSSLTSLLKIIESNIDAKICLISTSKYNLESNLSSSEIKYMKKNHRKIFNSNRLTVVDPLVSRSSINDKTALLQMHNFGGLASFWGGAYFPNSGNFKEDKKIQNFVQRNFRLINIPSNHLGIHKPKENSQNKQTLKQVDCRILLNKLSADNDKLEILDPGKEIIELTHENKIDLYKNIHIKKIDSLDNKEFILYGLKEFKLKAKFLIIGLGAINSSKLLIDSQLIKNQEIYLSDHKMYRVPILNLNKILFRNNKYNLESLKKEINISNLREAYKGIIQDKSIFLGLYLFPKNFFKYNFIINFLTNQKILIFSQIYLGNEKLKFVNKINFKKQLIKQKIISSTKLSIKEIIKILVFYLEKRLLPLPFKYGLKFGSSYHICGSLNNKNLNLDKIKELNNLEVIDSSTLNKIGSEPSSYLLIKNSFLRTEKLINYFKLASSNIGNDNKQ